MSCPRQQLCVLQGSCCPEARTAGYLGCSLEDVVGANLLIGSPAGILHGAEASPSYQRSAQAGWHCAALHAGLDGPVQDSVAHLNHSGAP